MTITIYVPNLGVIGGIETHLYSVAKLFRRRGHEVVLLCISNRLEASRLAQLRQLGVKVVDAPAFIRDRGPAARTAWLVVKAMTSSELRRSRILYTNAVGGTCGVLRRVMRPDRVIHHHHTSADDREQADWPAAYKKYIATVPELVACSAATASRLKAFGCRGELSVVHYLSQDLDQCPAPIRAAGQPVRVGYFGRLVESKGIGWLLNCAASPRFQGCEFHISGSGPAWPPREPAPSSVHFHGSYATRAQLAARMQDVDCVVLPSTHSEGMPLSLLEALSAGRPWVATRVGGVEEMSPSPDCGVVTEPDEQSFAAGLHGLAGRIERGSTYYDPVRRFYERHFSPARREQAWIDLVETHLAAR